MFILTLGTNDPEVVKKCLAELSQDHTEVLKLGAIGSLTTPDENNLGTQFEHAFLKEHEFLYMSEFLYFDKSGNKLILQVDELSDIIVKN